MPLERGIVPEIGGLWPKKLDPQLGGPSFFDLRVVADHKKT